MEFHNGRDNIVIIEESKFYHKSKFPKNPFDNEDGTSNTSAPFPLETINNFKLFIESNTIPEGEKEQAELYTICMYFLIKRRYMIPLLNEIAKVILKTSIHPDNLLLYNTSYNLKTEFKLFRRPRIML